MKAEMRKLVIVGVATLVSGVIIACGGNGATNNDQGVSVTFLGLYANLPNNNAGGNNNTTGTNLQGCTRFPNQAAQPTPIPLGDDDGYYAIAGVQNNLFGQFFRTNQIIVDYFIAGAAIQPPSYTAGISIFTGPAENSQNNLNNNNNNTIRFAIDTSTLTKLDGGLSSYNHHDSVLSIEYLRTYEHAGKVNVYICGRNIATLDALYERVFVKKSVPEGFVYIHTMSTSEDGLSFCADPKTPVIEIEHIHIDLVNDKRAADRGNQKFRLIQVKLCIMDEKNFAYR